MIDVVDLTREFRITRREPGLASALRSVVRRHHRTITAVDHVDLHVPGGTVLGLLGPNGSGKTTTLKCVAGLLTPTSGSVTVLGHTPSDREPDLLRRLGFVMGQRWQLHRDLPVAESFELHRIVYDLGRTAFRESRDELVELLDLSGFLRQPARRLSLGQRMRAEFAAALLHRPVVVLLDEPTLGLDFDAQQVIRTFVRAYLERTGAAVMLTSHYLADIEALADDVVTISRGRITFTGSMTALRAMAGDRQRVVAQVTRPLSDAELANLPPLGTVLEAARGEVVLEVRRGAAGAAVDTLERLEPVVAVSLTDPPLEDTLRGLYGEAAAAPSGTSPSGGSGAG